MTPPVDLRDHAIAFHRRLPERLWRYLEDRGIPRQVARRHLLGWNGERITIPIPDRDCRIALFKLAKDPEDPSPAPKMIATPGSTAELYGWDAVAAEPSELVLCEGEFDRLVLTAHGFPAATSTGGAGTFRESWAAALRRVPRVYVCFDRDESGRRGARRIARLLPAARIVSLPEAVGPGGDPTDFFVRLGHSADDFRRLLSKARPLAPPPDALPVLPKSHSVDRGTSSSRVARIKQGIPIESVIGQYVRLRRSGAALMGLCPFHSDRSPSLAVYPETGTYYCFGCRAQGDVITFLRAKERLGFRDALEVLERFAA